MARGDREGVFDRKSYLTLVIVKGVLDQKGDLSAKNKVGGNLPQRGNEIVAL